MSTPATTPLGPTEPPELPESVQPEAKPIWIWALLMAAALGGYQYLQADVARGSAYGMGYALGGAAIPLFAAWFATLFSKAAHTPTIAAGAVCMLLLTTGNATQRKIEGVKAEYATDLEERMAAWTKQGTVWAESGGCDPTVIQQHAELRTNLNLALELREATSELLSELDGGDLFLSKLADAGVSNHDSEAAWSHVKEETGFAQVRETLRSTQALLHAAAIYLAELEHTFGKWHVGDDGALLFDEGVSDSAIKRVNDAVDEMQLWGKKLAEAAERPR